jgi:hypothetical protein
LLHHLQHHQGMKSLTCPEGAYWGWSGEPPFPGFQLQPITEIIESNRKTLQTVRTTWNDFEDTFYQLEVGLIQNPVPGNKKFQLDRFTYSGCFIDFLNWHDVIFWQKHLKELTLHFHAIFLLTREQADREPVFAFTAMENFVTALLREIGGSLTALSVSCRGYQFRSNSPEFTWSFQGILSQCNRLKSSLELFFIHLREDSNYRPLAVHFTLLTLSAF